MSDYIDSVNPSSSKFAVLNAIKNLDPLRDHQRIVFLSGCYDFPFDTQRALEFALLRTFAVPSSSRLMVESREFTAHTQKRYDDTTIIISTIGFYGYDSDEGRRAIRRMNQIHRHYPIPNHEFLYVLSTFVLEPIRWNARFGWRPLHAHEKLANFYFWREVGKRMNIHAIPESLEAMERFNRDYEAEHFAYSPNNQELAEATRDLFLSWVLPGALAPLRPWLAYSLYALMDKPMCRAFGFPEAPLWLRWTVGRALQWRSLLLRLLPPRRKPYRLPAPRTYPQGYALEDLGPTHTLSEPKQSS